MKGGFTPEKIYQPKFPINFATRSGMRFLAHLYHDGSIGKLNRQPHYVNKSFDQCKEFLEDSKDVFGSFDRKIVLRKDGTYSINLPTIIGDLLVSLGYTPGDRTVNNAETLEFLNSITDKQLIAEFLSRAYNDEGYVGKRLLGIAQVSLIKNGVVKIPNVLLLDKLYLEKLQIKNLKLSVSEIYTNRHGKCAKFVLNVYSKEYLRIFADNVKLIDYKRKKLENYLNNGYLMQKRYCIINVIFI